MADAKPNPPHSSIPNAAVARTLDYRGRGGRGNGAHHIPSVRLWDKFRRAFTRQSLKSAFKTLLWAVPLTILIWVYAERDGVHETLGFSMVIGLRNDDSQHRIVHMESPPDGRIHVDLKGPNALLENLEKNLSSSVDEVRIDVDPNLSAGTHPISLAEIGNDPHFVQAGVSVSNPEPPDITVTVDPLVHKNYEVQAPASLNLASPPVFEPRDVHVHMPQSLKDSGTFVAIAQLDAFPDIKTPGTHDLSNVPVAIYRLTAAGSAAMPVNEPSLTISPAVVSAKVEVKNADETYELQHVPVWPTMPTVMQDQYQVKLGDPTQNGVLLKVKVVGPPSQIALLNQPDSPRPFAWFEVNPSNRQTNTNYTSPIHVEGMPDGVHVSPDDQNRTITYQLTDRAATGS
ncbi:MAG TPA: hypothetical protein VHY37_03645 [Tepidisphaeraceae bacterium]|jgi:hypothetical protein|nr:hypothetical protein [Tepidisphaeraceae bacterium]